MIKAEPIKHIDNERVAVTEWRFKPGAATGWHRHEYAYVVIPLMDGKLRVVTTTGEGIFETKKGLPYYRDAGVEHDVINAGDADYAFIDIEIK